MTTNDQLSLHEMQKIQVDILDYIHKVCEENDIKYFIAYGSLLGAVRHKGFIPWDDDIDIMLPRDDYNKLRDYFKNHTTYPYTFICNDFLNDFRAPLPKIIDSRTVLKQNCGYIEGIDLGVYIDLFIMDGCGDDIETARKNYKRSQKLHKSWKYSNQSIFVDYHSKIYCILRAIKNLPYKLIGYQKMLDRVNNNNRLINYYSSKYVAALDFQSYSIDKSIFLRDLFSDGKPIEFEGRYFMGPSNPHEVLKIIYGNYMQLPPEEKRHSNHKYIAYFKEGTI